MTKYNTTVTSYHYSTYQLEECCKYTKTCWVGLYDLVRGNMEYKCIYPCAQYCNQTYYDIYTTQSFQNTSCHFYTYVREPALDARMGSTMRAYPIGTTLELMHYDFSNICHLPKQQLIRTNLSPYVHLYILLASFFIMILLMV